MKETALPSGQRVGLSDSYSGVLGSVTSIYQSPLVSTCIKGNPDSEIQQIFACGSQIESGKFLLVEARSNPGNFCSWRSWYPVFSLLGIRNPTNDCNLQYALLSRNPESSTWSPKSTAWNPDSKTVMKRNQRHCFREPWKERPVPLKKLPLHYIPR